MRKLAMLCLFIPILGMSQTKNVINSSRFFPKIDKVSEFEKALANHAQKYHSGDWKWRVFEIETGPDAGGYHITEGPVTWDQVDSRGNLGAEHMADWNKNVAPFLSEKYSSMYSEYQEDFSTVALGDYSDKIAINHIFPKPGCTDKVEELLKKIKKAWTAGNQTVAVYTSSSSGPTQYSLVTRYKQGLKERDKNFRKPFKERFEATNGEGSYENYLESVSKYTDHSWSELLFLRPELSSK
jgi:hypothetical protein